MALLADYHLHTHFSGDSDASMEEMVQSAIAKGLTHICFTEHMDLDYPMPAVGEPLHFEVNTDSYLFELLTMKEKYASQIQVNFGIELGLQPHLQREQARYINSFDFDFIIASTHVCNRVDPYYPEFFAGKTDVQAHSEYFECTLENIKKFSNFDVYGHLDYIVRYGMTTDANYSYSQHADVIDAILEKLIDKEKGLEINTAGFRKGLRDVHPYTDVLKRYKELGGEIVTIGSDSHEPGFVGDGFEKAREVLLNCGFKYYAVFDKRMAEYKKI